MSGAVPKDDVAILQRRLAGLDVQKAAILANAKHDYAAIRDNAQAACAVQAQINKLLGRPPQSPTGL